MTFTCEISSITVSCYCWNQNVSIQTRSQPNIWGGSFLWDVDPDQAQSQTFTKGGL